MSTLVAMDPRTVPVVGIDSHLPAVAEQLLQPGKLEDRFRSPPAWVPELRSEVSFSDRAFADAAVLMAVVTHDRPTLLLTQRTSHLSTHAGQIAFPGGKCDPEDEDAAATALREAWEEVGLDPNRVQILGELPVYTTGSSFRVTPVVGLVKPGFRLNPNPDEVSEVFEVPLDYLMNPATHRRHLHMKDGVRREWFSMPWFDGQREHFVWGATAGMIRNFYCMLIA